MKMLRGISWDHPRGFGPMSATAAEFQRRHPDVQITWEKRSLHDFGAAPVDHLAAQYDLVVLDHPWVGFIAETGCYLPLDRLLPDDTLEALASRSAGPSHQSYEYDCHQWALAIDAATPSASYRPDLLTEFMDHVPTRWDEVVDLAQRANAAGKRVAIPLGAVDAITVFISLADNIGGQPFARPDGVVGRDCGRAVMDAMRTLASLFDRSVFDMTPISLMDRMSSSDEIVYCPMAYSYSNYARDGFRAKLCRYADMPAMGDGPDGSHIGGTGLAISSRCKHPEVAAEYAAFVASGDCQRTIYFDAGGQPAHADAWEDPRVNKIAHNFFIDTRETIERSFVRPRYNGYIGFQYPAGVMVRSCLMNDGEVDQLLSDLDQLFHDSRVTAKV